MLSDHMSGLGNGAPTIIPAIPAMIQGLSSTPSSFFKLSFPAMSHMKGVFPFQISPNLLEKLKEGKDAKLSLCFNSKTPTFLIGEESFDLQINPIPNSEHNYYAQEKGSSFNVLGRAVKRLTRVEDKGVAIKGVTERIKQHENSRSGNTLRLRDSTPKNTNLLNKNSQAPVPKGPPPVSRLKLMPVKNPQPKPAKSSSYLSCIVQHKTNNIATEAPPPAIPPPVSANPAPAPPPSAAPPAVSPAPSAVPNPPKDMKDSLPKDKETAVAAAPANNTRHTEVAPVPVPVPLPLPPEQTHPQINTQTNTTPAIAPPSSSSTTTSLSSSLKAKIMIRPPSPTNNPKVPEAKDKKLVRRTKSDVLESQKTRNLTAPHPIPAPASSTPEPRIVTKKIVPNKKKEPVKETPQREVKETAKEAIPKEPKKDAVPKITKELRPPKVTPKRTTSTTAAKEPMPMPAPTPALPQSTSKKEEPLKIPPPQLQPLTIKTTLAETRKKEREIKRKIDEVEKPIVNLPNPKRRRPSPVHSPPRESPESFIDVESQPSPLPPPAQGGLGAGKRPTVRDELPPAAPEPQDSMSLSPLPIRIPKQPPVRPTNATSSKPPKVTLIVNKKNNYDSDHEPPKKTIKIVIPIKLMDKAPPPKTNTAMEVEKKHIREERNTNTNTNTTATNPKSTNTTANTISISSNTKTNNTSNTNNTNIIKNTNTNTSTSNTNNTNNTSNTNNTNNTKIPNSNATINTTLIPKNSNNGVTAGKGASVPNQDTNVANLMRLSDIPFGIKLDHITDSPSPPPQTPKTLEEFQNLKADFDRKHAFYMEIYAQLKLNEDHFRQLSDAWKVIKKTDDRKKIELQINHLYTQRSESVSKMKRKCDTLTEELTRISHHLQNFLNAIPVR